ncbi:hypothetical protein ACIQHV_32665, partial [Bacillus bombysepticus]
NHLHLPFRKKKQSRLKLILHKLSLIAMWRYPKDEFAEYVLEKLHVDYIRHKAIEIENGKTAANIEFKEEQDMFHVHIFE